MYKVGFTFDEKILMDYELESFFDLLPQNSVQSVELSPDLSLLPLSTYKDIGKYIEKKNGDLNFHVPYFVNQNNFDFSGDKNVITKYYTKLLSIIESLRQYSVKIPSLVIHGATINSENDSKSLNDTLVMIDYLLNFISKKNIDIELSFESLSNTSNMIGRSRDEVLRIINEFKSKKLQICWDLCHDYFNYNDYFLPDDNFIDGVNYVHIHGKNKDGIKHTSTKDHFDYSTFFNNHSFTQTINIEILKDLCGPSYYSSLYQDIKLLNSL